MPAAVAAPERRSRHPIDHEPRRAPHEPHGPPWRRCRRSEPLPRGAIPSPRISPTVPARGSGEASPVSSDRTTPTGAQSSSRVVAQHHCRDAATPCWPGERDSKAARSTSAAARGEAAPGRLREACGSLGRSAVGAVRADARNGTRAASRGAWTARGAAWSAPSGLTFEGQRRRHERGSEATALECLAKRAWQGIPSSAWRNVPGTVFRQLNGPRRGATGPVMVVEASRPGRSAARGRWAHPVRTRSGRPAPDRASLDRGTPPCRR
jgi:hypothetical protein